MNIKFRQETARDHKIVEDLVEAAFKGQAFSDQTEHLLVNRLRLSDAFIPGLSIVAEHDGRIVGHVLLTKIIIRNEANSFDSLSLAPVSVLPEMQKKGIGGQLIREAHQRAQSLGFGSVVLLGHSEYYPRFGYKMTSEFGIKLPFEAPPENCMVVELTEGALKEVSGIVEYPKAFFE